MAVPQRIRYKLCLLVYKALHGLALQYPTDFCQPVSLVSGRSGLRSSTRGDLIVVSTSTNFRRRSFAVSAPAAWNQLPSDIKICSRWDLSNTDSRLICLNCNWHVTVFRGTLTIRALVMGDGALCYGALEIVGLLLLLLLMQYNWSLQMTRDDEAHLQFAWVQTT